MAKKPSKKTGKRNVDAGRVVKATRSKKVPMKGSEGHGKPAKPSPSTPKTKSTAQPSESDSETVMTKPRPTKASEVSAEGRKRQEIGADPERRGPATTHGKSGPKSAAKEDEEVDDEAEEEEADEEEDEEEDFEGDLDDEDLDDEDFDGDVDDEEIDDDDEDDEDDDADEEEEKDVGDRLAGAQEAEDGESRRRSRSSHHSTGDGDEFAVDDESRSRDGLSAYDD